MILAQDLELPPGRRLERRGLVEPVGACEAGIVCILRRGVHVDGDDMILALFFARPAVPLAGDLGVIFVEFSTCSLGEQMALVQDDRPPGLPECAVPA